jgi:hypothetical protein
MSFKSEVMDIIRTVPQWSDVSADAAEFSDMSLRKNSGRCHEINPEVARALNHNPGIEAIVAGTHYPVDSAGCAHYYVLARSRKTGEVLLADAVINSEVPDMKQPFVGSLDEARDFMKTHVRLNQQQWWNFDHIVVHQPEVDMTKRASFRNRWSEVGRQLVFDVPEKKTESGPAPQGHIGEPPSMDEMTKWAARRGLPTQYIGVNLGRK